MKKSEYSRPRGLRRFQQEAMAAAALNDPGIIAVYDVGTQDGFPYVVSELLVGETLRDRLRNGALSRRKSVEFGIQIARALAAAHGDRPSRSEAGEYLHYVRRTHQRQNCCMMPMEFMRDLLLSEGLRFPFGDYDFRNG